MTENRPAEAGEQLPEVIGEPVLPDSTERLTEEEIAMLSSLYDRLTVFFGSAELRARMQSIISTATGGADDRRD